MAGLIKRPCTVNLQCHDVKDIDGDLLQSLAMATQTDIIEDLDDHSNMRERRNLISFPKKMWNED